MPQADVSVVVPFYNVRDDVKRCVDSLIAQTFNASRYELVLVDDGSTDGTGALLDVYAANVTSKPAITVLHQENQGLSAARNYGVRMSTGTYVTFVDGDDCVSEQYLERLWQGLESLPSGTQRPLVISLYDYRDKHGVNTVGGLSDYSAGRSPHNSAPTRNSAHTQPAHAIMGTTEAMNAVLYGEIPLSAWGKLAPRIEYVEHPFPEGRLYEDLSSIARLVHDSESVAVVDEPLYHYVIHDGSIVHSATIDERQTHDFALAIGEFTSQSMRFFRDDPQFDVSAFTYQQSLHCARLFTALDDAVSKERCRTIVRFVRKRLPGFIGNRRIPLRERLRLGLLCACPALYRKLFRLFIKFTRGVG